MQIVLVGRRRGEAEHPGREAHAEDGGETARDGRRPEPGVGAGGGRPPARGVDPAHHQDTVPVAPGDVADPLVGTAIVARGELRYPGEHRP